MNLLLNAPMWLIVAISLLGCAAVFMALRNGEREKRNIGLGILAVAVVLLLLRSIVETDEKKVERQSRELIAAVSAKDWSKARPLLKHANFMGTTGDELTNLAQQDSDQWGLEKVNLNSVEVTRNPNIISAAVSVTSEHKAQYFDRVPSNWSLEYQKRGNEWVLMNISLVSVPLGGDKSVVENALRKK